MESNPAREDLDRVRRIVLGVLAAQPARLFLFGSRARGDAGPRSDIDIAVLPQLPLAEGTLARMREALEESTIPYLVDVVDLTDADETFRRRVIEEGVPWND
jgi:uncharacterized protein